ncbi:uncharacterized protein LOC134192824 [Corticium candelabrum]|uniref:uncharacterized protein LOC134192824 n=1 Tax=Corticium candelabrum TaxID=121492 RepID=UPI002E25A5E3|nr:uncharacterized protein LOC134192824 [Corticium candelabrum]
MRMKTLRVQLLLSLVFILATSSYATKLDLELTKHLCENDPPYELKSLCRSKFGVTCPSEVKFGDWEYTLIDVNSSVNSTEAIYCPGEQLLKYERRTDLSSVPSECRSGVRIDAEQQYRCPPSLPEKAIRLGRIFGSFDSPSSNTLHEQPPAVLRQKT